MSTAWRDKGGFGAAVAVTLAIPVTALTLAGISLSWRDVGPAAIDGCLLSYQESTFDLQTLPGVEWVDDPIFGRGTLLMAGREERIPGDREDFERILRAFVECKMGGR